MKAIDRLEQARNTDGKVEVRVSELVFLLGAIQAALRVDDDDIDEVVVDLLGLES